MFYQRQLIRVKTNRRARLFLWIKSWNRLHFLPVEIHVTNRSWANVQGVEQNQQGRLVTQQNPRNNFTLWSFYWFCFFFFFLISEVLFKSILSLYFGVLMGFWLHYIGKCSKLFCPHSVIGLKWKCLWRKDKQREICRVYCAWLPRSVDVVFHQEQKQIFLKERGGRKKTSPDIRYYADSGWGEPEPSTLSWKNTSTLL